MVLRMKRLNPSSALNDGSAWASADGESRGLTLFSASRRSSQTSMWILAIAGLVFAVVASNLLCLSPRWYSNRFMAFVYEPARFVILTTACGGCAVQIFWELLSDLPSVGRMEIVRNLSGAWVFLPCFVLLYEQNSPWMLLLIALIAIGMAFGMRRLVPVAGRDAVNFEAGVVLPSLYGLPPVDSPLLLAFWIAIFAQAGLFLAIGGALLPAAYALSVSVFLVAFRWSTFDGRSVDWWIGRHPPLRQASVAILLTSMTLIPFAIGGDIGFLGLHRPPIKFSAKHNEAEASSGYYGIVLYPPPHKKEIVAPVPRDLSLRAGAMARPMNLPFDGQYWYFKWPNRRPSEKAHIAHGKPIDANVNPRSTDGVALQMEAHQKLPEPIDLARYGEIDVAITNADTRVGEIALLAMVRDSAAPGKPSQSLGQQVIASSQQERIPADRGPVKEVLRFRIAASHTMHRFDEITILFVPASGRARSGAKVSIDSFELMPKP
ncbi:MAG: hypothetical protein M3O31_15655 [Acidobacteriota bacterium]|nr:hypothetical protein [Acidobacteriota bacterium]